MSLFKKNKKQQASSPASEAEIVLLVKKVRELEHAAMDIWLQDMPDIQLVQFYNRPGINQHYWKNWPTAATDPYMNGIHPHTGFAYTLLNLEPTGAQ